MSSESFAPRSAWHFIANRVWSSANANDIRSSRTGGSNVTNSAFSGKKRFAASLSHPRPNPWLWAMLSAASSIPRSGQIVASMSVVPIREPWRRIIAAPPTIRRLALTLGFADRKGCAINAASRARKDFHIRGLSSIVTLCADSTTGPTSPSIKASFLLVCAASPRSRHGDADGPAIGRAAAGTPYDGRLSELLGLHEDT